MTDLTKLTADELRVRFDVLRPKMNVPARLVLAEISRRLERLEALELENAALDAGGGRMAERLAKCEAVAEYAQHYASCQFLESGIGHIMPCTCGLNVARAAREEK